MVDEGAAGSADAGIIELDSGRWAWTAAEDPGGWRLYYRHLSKPKDEMLSWFSGRELNEASVEEAARTPLHRFWEDAEGEVWRVSLEIAALPLRRRGLFREGMMLVFRAGGLRVEVPVPGEPPIGEFTDEQLAGLLER
jgi:hypothetical protein